MTAGTDISNKVLAKIFVGTDWSPPATRHVSLHTASPGSTGASELSGGSYGRRTETFATPSSKATSNLGTITFSGLPAATLTHVGVWDAATAGNFLAGGPLNSPVTITAGASFEIAIGDLDITVV